MSDDIKKQIDELNEKLDRILEMVESNHQNTVTVYRRTSALAQMVEALAEGREPRITRAMRAEIDASLNPKDFVQLAENDPDAFVHRYGKQVYNSWKTSGLSAILPIGDLAPTKSEYKKRMQ